jgi:hypothetical protein
VRIPVAVAVVVELAVLDEYFAAGNAALDAVLVVTEAAVADGQSGAFWSGTDAFLNSRFSTVMSAPEVTKIALPLGMT